MADLILSGTLELSGSLYLAGSDGGKVKVDDSEVVVEKSSLKDPPQGNAPGPVPIPPPPSSPSDPGIGIWIINSFNKTVKAGGKCIVTQGVCVQGTAGKAAWPGVAQPSLKNAKVTVNRIPVNVKDDMCIIFPTGASVPIDNSGQESQ